MLMGEYTAKFHQVVALRFPGSWEDEHPCENPTNAGELTALESDWSRLITVKRDIFWEKISKGMLCYLEALARTTFW